MGILNDMSIGLAGIHGQNKQREAQSQSVLLELVTSVPELMDNPEVAGALGQAFQFNPGIPAALGKLKEARRTQQLTQMQAKIQEQRAIGDLQLGNDIERMAAESGLPGADAIINAVEPGETPRDDLLITLGDLSQGQRDVAKSEATEAAAAELARDVYLKGLDHQNKLEIERTKADVSSANIAGAIKGIGGLVLAGQRLTNTPPMTPGAEDASENLVNLEMERLRLGQSQLLQVAQLDQILSEDDGIFGIGGQKSPGIAVLYGQLSNNPQGFNQLYGDQWTRAKEDASLTLTNEDLQQSMLARDDLAPLNLQLIEGTSKRLREIEADRRQPELNTAAAGVTQELADLLGVDFPELTQQVPPIEVESVPSPYISMEELPSDIQSMYLQAEGMPELQEMYKQIIGASRGQWGVTSAAMGYLRERVEYYMENPAPEGEAVVTQ